MSETFLIWVVTVIYASQSVYSAYLGNYSNAMIVFGYAVANIGLIWSMYNNG